MTTNVLLRDVPSKTYAQVGATGNRFFTLDRAVPLPQGGICCRGFTQSVSSPMRPTRTADNRSFRHSSSGLPLLNIDLAFSAFLAPGPALEVLAKMLAHGRGPPGRGGGAAEVANSGGGLNTMGRSGYGSDQRGPPEIHFLEKGQIDYIKRKLRGVKVSVALQASSYCSSRSPTELALASIRLLR